MKFLKKKPNSNQAMFLAAVLQTLAIGLFVWVGNPALNAVVAGDVSGLAPLAVTAAVYAAATVAGYVLLD